ncbi:hypothetical protein G6F35_017953 [Rhizopus arrhizus]|nr:hypothetical protein G6F35_017953 [Rhizopus arrhizus]
MLQVRRDMFEAAREQNVMTGTVRIGVAETIVQTWLPTRHHPRAALAPDVAPDRPCLPDGAGAGGTGGEPAAVHLSLGLGSQPHAGSGARTADPGTDWEAAHHHLPVQ